MTLWGSPGARKLAIDEAQRLPRLFPALRYAIDHGRGNGRYVLLGSASPGLMKNSSETLAGRIGLLELTPFTMAELATTSHAKNRWFWGGFPRVHALRGEAKRAEWLDGYEGGHFAAWEEPLLFASEMRAAFKPLR